MGNCADFGTKILHVRSGSASAAAPEWLIAATGAEDAPNAGPAPDAGAPNAGTDSAPGAGNGFGGEAAPKTEAAGASNPGVEPTAGACAPSGASDGVAPNAGAAACASAPIYSCSCIKAANVARAGEVQRRSRF